MAVMVWSVSSSLVCVLCVILLPAVWADICTSYRDEDGVYHGVQLCRFQYCCGNCQNKYCCSDQENQLSQKKQEDCPGRPVSAKQINIAAILGGIFATIILIILCVVLIICFLSPSCLFYKKCRKGHNQRRQTVTTTNVVNVPQQPLSPSVYQPSYPGYQPVPALHGYGGPPIPTAPPHSYLEASDPTHFPAPFLDGQPMYPLQPPSALPSHSDELAQPPYNPSYGPNP
ncbi:protein shisa-5-like [Toxotes jaculatrix]|uniref:protein shisa-5-like n=1 Tax=Toxotes jaculatrix TaxID=941984 RepID=UPI001B3B0FBB|nr:protein shisa-5-like [Toxotes jaculatrix]